MFRATIFCLIAFFGSNIAAVANEIELQSFTKIGREFSISQNPSNRDDTSSLSEALKSAKAGDKELIEALKKQKDTLPPLYLFHLAKLTILEDPQEAVHWYFLGWIRARYDAVLCEDTTAAQGIGYLPAIAPSVAAFAQNNPTVAGDEGLKILQSGEGLASRASPIWICSHGARGVARALEDALPPESKEKLNIPENRPKVSWLISEEDMVEKYSKITKSMTTFFQKLTEPLDEKTPMAKVMLEPELVKSDKNILSLFWASDDKFVLEENPINDKTSIVWLYGASEHPKMLSTNAMTNRLCVAGGNMAVTLSRYYPAPKSNGDKQLRFVSGSMDDWLEGYQYKDEVLTWQSIREADLQKNRRLLLDNKNIGAQQSRIDCSWLKTEELDLWDGLDKSEVKDWNDLGFEKGYLYSVENVNSKSMSVFYKSFYDGSTKKISSEELPLSCIRYVPHMDRYMVNGCQTFFIGRRGKRIENERNAIIWLAFENDNPDLIVESYELLPNERGSSQAIPTKVGLVRMVQERATAVGNKPGGLYLYKSNDNVEKIWEGVIDKVELSSNGCHLLFTEKLNFGYAKRNLRNVWKADLCKYAS